MESTVPGLLIFFILFAVNLNSAQCSKIISPVEEESELMTRLKSINKPAIKSFQTKDGDILDCIEINKQLAFDHPLLKNHTIQMKPSSKIKRITSSSSTRFKASELMPKNIKCPKGTVLIRRVQKEDLLMKKLAPFSSSTKLLHQGQQDENDNLIAHQTAALLMNTNNKGVNGKLNVWQPEVSPGQFSCGAVYVENVDESVVNSIAAGWCVNKLHNQRNLTRLFASWSTRDSGKTEGCFDMECPAFVQTSRKYPLGIVVSPLSVYHGNQYEITANIVQDDVTGNWWVKLAGENIGYYPKELFTTLATEASGGGWGGQIYSPVTQNYPGMGSGHFPEEKFKGAAYIDDMKLLDNSYSVIYPEKYSLVEIVTKSKCYRVLYEGGPDHVMYYGGPPNCVWNN